MSRTRLLVLATLALLAIARSAAAQSTSKVDLSSIGNEGLFGTDWEDISADGRFVAFGTSSPDLVPGVTNLHRQIFLHDRESGSTVCASRARTQQGGNANSRYPHLSGDGRLVVYVSEASDLVANDTNGKRDVFVYDSVSDRIRLVSVSSSGVQGDEDSVNPAISRDGRFVAFASTSLDLVTGLRGRMQVYRHDLLTGTTIRVSDNFAGLAGNDHSDRPAISADGSLVSFMSWASDLVPGDVNGTADVVLIDLTTGRRELVSVGRGGVQGDESSWISVMSPDGRFVAFTSYATNLVAGDTNGMLDVFVRDRRLGTTERVSLGSGGQQADGSCNDPRISDDGRYVCFHSTAGNLVSPDTASGDVFVRDRRTRKTTLESVDDAGAQPPDGGSSSPAGMSADGRFLVFGSWKLTPPVKTGSGAYLRDRVGCSPTVASYCEASATSIPGCVAALGSTGTPSCSDPGAFAILSGAVPGGGLGLVCFGLTGIEGPPVGSQGGRACIEAPLAWTVARPTGGTPGSCDGSLRFTLLDLVDVSPIVQPGAVVHAWIWFRDAASADGFATSDALWFQVCP